MVGLVALEAITPLHALLRSRWSPPPSLATTRLGLTFPSPIGIAGGFDKDARVPRALAALGFGFLEIGTVTALPQEANPSPNLFRLPDDRALVNRLGFPNDGAVAVAQRFEREVGRGGAGVPVGFSIGKSRAVPISPIGPVLDDYLASFRAVRGVADFVVVNVSSPNTKDLRALQTTALARALLTALVDENEREGRRLPLLLKISPDLDDSGLDALLDVIRETGVDGVIATNTTVARRALVSRPADVEAAGHGGLSGPPLRARALAIVAKARAKLGPSATVIGVGGIETGEDAHAFLAAGADLVQLYTAFVYRGPATAVLIARELHEARER
jgi:dihydroorotate dehydrogenase